MPKNLPKPQTFSNTKKIYHLFKDYFTRSDEKLVAWFLLIGTIVCVVSLVAIMTAISWWTAGFWALLTAKAALTPFLYSVGQFSLLALGYVAAAVLKNYLIGKLSIRWRNWVTIKMINKLFKSENNYLELKRFSSHIANIGQRIQEDIKNYVELALSIGTNFLKSICSLAAFTSSLWVVGGPLAFTLLGLNVVIPGYLVWVALVVAIIATAITYGVGRSFAKVTRQSEDAEANLRQDLLQLNAEAESVAEEHAEKYYKTSIESKVQAVKKTATKKLNAQTKIIAFQNFYFQIASVLPSICAAPLYFSGLIEIGQLMQIGLSFMEVSVAMSMFVEGFQEIASCKASIDRIVRLENRLAEKALPSANERAIERRVRDKDSIKDWIRVKNLDIMPPQKVTPPNSNHIMRGLTIKLNPGEHVLIKGSSGIGKSTFFKVLSGTWKYGSGKVALPANKSFYFLPQRPVLPHDTLRAVLAYGEPVETYRQEEYAEALRLVGMGHLAPLLDEKRAWSQELSGGEQQRIAIARPLLKKPTWLCLDEATSALDKKSQDNIYRMLKAKLGATTTFLSIGHSSEIEKHHTKILFFKKQKNKAVTVTETILEPVVAARI